MACTLLAVLPAFDAAAQAPAPPANGFSLALSATPLGWSTNPDELPARRKPDYSTGGDVALGHRWSLWDGAALSITGSAALEMWRREAGAGFHRLGGAMALSQTWRGATFTLGAGARSSLNQHFTRHDSASHDINFTISRPVALTETLTLIVNAGAARRFYGDGTEDDTRLRFGLTLAQRFGAFTLRVGGGFGWLIEDRTRILPRINDRSLSANLSGTYEWAKDRDIGLRLAFIRAYSSYSENRYKAWSLAPQISATMRF